MSDDPAGLVSVRYMVDDVGRAIDFYTAHLGFTLRTSAAPAFADVVRGNLRLLISGPKSSAGRPMPDGRTPEPGGFDFEQLLHHPREVGVPIESAESVVHLTIQAIEVVVDFLVRGDGPVALRLHARHRLLGRGEIRVRARQHRCADGRAEGACL